MKIPLLWALVLETIRTVSQYAIENREEFEQKVREEAELRQAEAAKDLKKKINKAKKRSAELDILMITKSLSEIMQLYPSLRKSRHFQNLHCPQWLVDRSLLAFAHTHNRTKQENTVCGGAVVQAL